MNRLGPVALLALGSLLLAGGCTSTDVAQSSPTVRLLRGDMAAGEYREAVAAANEETREAEQFEVNRVPTRAYNTVTGRYEFIPEDTQQRWNETAQRWEFTPLPAKRALPAS